VAHAALFAHPFTLYGETHRFRSDYSGIDFGREHDLGLTYSFGEHCVVRLQRALRSRGGHGAGSAHPQNLADIHLHLLKAANP